MKNIKSLVKLVNCFHKSKLKGTYEDGIFNLLVYDSNALDLCRSNKVSNFVISLVGNDVLEEVRCLDFLGSACTTFTYPKSFGRVFSRTDTDIPNWLFPVGVKFMFQFYQISEEDYNLLLANCPFLSLNTDDVLTGLTGYILGTGYSGKVFSESGLIYEDKELSRGYFFTSDVVVDSVMTDIANLICSVRSTDLLVELSASSDTSCCGSYLEKYFNSADIELVVSRVCSGYSTSDNVYVVDKYAGLYSELKTNVVPIRDGSLLSYCLGHGGVSVIDEASLVQNLINRLSVYIADDNTDLSSVLKVTIGLLKLQSSSTD